ncbi:hypothetical protein B6U80_00435 [Candidatus Pacearchaeota archaeon ex4484_26]|nr:MAG: hypothetical protein B6U80_00435 [Candidatus Pacearchaeota archaeon ex4484_26]RLF34915.1 MAG: hypothetical protein DRM99_05670 [Thermoplasmata archaeon]
MRTKADKEKIAFHKGAVVTLMAERRELVKMVNAVNSLIMGHIKSLRDLGVDFKKEVNLSKK